MIFGYWGFRTKIAAGAAIIAGVISVYYSFQEMSRLGNSPHVPGIVIELRDRGPYKDEPDTFGLEYPTVEYIDEHGVTRKKPIWKGAFPGYFHVGQELVMARTHAGYEIADRWFIWQNTLAYLAFATILTGVAVAYHLFVRAPNRRMTKRKRSSRVPVTD